LRFFRLTDGLCWPCASSGSLLALRFFFGPTAGLALLQAHCWSCASSGPLLILHFSGPLLALRFFWPTVGYALLLASLRLSALRLFCPLCDFRR
jgi:hypothetical protein